MSFLYSGSPIAPSPDAFDITSIFANFVVQYNSSVYGQVSEFQGQIKLLQNTLAFVQPWTFEKEKEKLILKGKEASFY